MPEDLTVLGVWAHPDDESYGPAGTFRKLADEGVRTAVLVATRGQMGGNADPSIATPASLPEVREAELRDAAAILGIGDVAVLDYRDGQLMATDVLELRGEVVRVIRGVRPDVVVTFGPAGVYGHPDHVQISRVVTEAFTAAGNADNYPEHIEQGLAPYSPSKLYYLAVPEYVAGRISESGIIPDHDSDSPPRWMSARTWRQGYEPFAVIAARRISLGTRRKTPLNCSRRSTSSRACLNRNSRSRWSTTSSRFCDSRMCPGEGASMISSGTVVELC